MFEAPLERAFSDLEKVDLAVQRITAMGEAKPGAEVWQQWRGLSCVLCCWGFRVSGGNSLSYLYIFSYKRLHFVTFGCWRRLLGLLEAPSVL